MAEQIDATVDRMEARHPDAVRRWFAARPELIERNREITRSSILAEIECLRDGAVVPDEIPGVDGDLARFAAYLGSPLEFMLWGYRNGHRVQWESFLDLLDDLDPAPSPQRRRELLDAAAAFFFTYADRLSDLVTQVYTHEREQLLRGTEQRRMQAVARLLEGQDADADALGYDPTAHHIGLVLSGTDGPAAARSLGTLLDRRVLVLAIDDGLWWGWLGGKKALGDIAVRAGLADWVPPDGTIVAAGGESPGPDGFGITHREAAAAYIAARRDHAPLTLFSDIALESLASADGDAARRFVARELAGIDGTDHRSSVLRETLRAWFAHGQNAASAATALGVHEQTVAQRLRGVEERTGRAPALRRAELDVALRLAAGQTS
jgi:hypothetical protein